MLHILDKVLQGLHFVMNLKESLNSLQNLKK